MPSTHLATASQSPEVAPSEAAEIPPSLEPIVPPEHMLCDLGVVRAGAGRVELCTVRSRSGKPVLCLRAVDHAGRYTRLWLGAGSGVALQRALEAGVRALDEAREAEPAPPSGRIAPRATRRDEAARKPGKAPRSWLETNRGGRDGVK
jgi:hypothetical protein